MRTRPLTAMALVAIATLASCGATQGASSAGTSDTIVLGSRDGVTVLEPGGETIQAQNALATPDWSTLFSAEPQMGQTTLTTTDVRTGHRDSVHLGGEMAVRAVAADGTRVALVADGNQADPWVPVPRARTTIAVADPTGSAEERRYTLRGNYEPEAFSSDHRYLYLISYLPPTDPTSYRVAGLDLRRGRVADLFGPDKSPPERMNGTRYMQVVSPDHDYLYTLYSSQPAAYSGSGGGWSGYGDRPVAFIHTLSLKEGLAICVGLPKAFGPLPAGAASIAVASDGSSVYAIAPSKGLVAVMDPEKLQVVDQHRVDFGTNATGSIGSAATVGPDGTLYVGAQAGVLALDPETFTVKRRWTLDGPVVGLGMSPDGRHLYAALGSEVQILDPTGRATGTIATPGMDGAVSVGSLAR